MNVKSDFIKVKNLYSYKDTIMRGKKSKPKTGTKYLKPISEKELQYSEYIKSSYKQVGKRHIIQLKNAPGGVK